MAPRSLPGLILKAATPPDEPDAELLGRFVRDRDGAAFEGLVRRHGPMVWGVCRKLLGGGPDAEDAFQATFLVLVRKAGKVSPRGMVGNWLYGVAWRTATHLRTRLASAGARRRELHDVPDARTPEPAADDTAAVVHAELFAMPHRYRAAVVLCELEGHTLADAARLLGVAVGTVASRLSRGRALLAARLRRRGLAASVTAGLVASDTPVSAQLCEAAAALGKTGQHEATRTVADLTQGVIHAMLTQKLNAAARVAVMVVLFAGVAGLGAWAATAQQPPAKNADDGDKYNDRLTPPGKKGRMENLWDDLARGEPYPSRAILEFASMPKHTLEHFKTHLRPLKVDKEQVRKWIADLASDKEEVWKPAYIQLDYFHPVLAMKSEDAWAEAKNHPAKHRVGVLLVGAPELVWVPDPVRERENEIDLVWRTDNSFPAAERSLRLVVPRPRLVKNGFEQPMGLPQQATQEYFVPSRVVDVHRPTWTRATRAVVILEHIGGPEALAQLKEMAKGHPDAHPTQIAKEAVKRLTAPPP